MKTNQSILGSRVELSGWQGGTTGLRVGEESLRRVFHPLKRILQRVRVELPGHEAQPRCRINPTFWSTCPEIRHAEIGRWMTKRGDKPWSRGKPPKYSAELVTVDGNTATIRILQETN